MTKSLTSILFAAAVLAIAGCSDNPNGPRRVAEVTLTLIDGGNVMTVGQVAQVAVRGTLTDDTEIDLTALSDLISLDPSVVTVTPAGVVTAVGVGTTEVRGTYEGRRSELSFVVN